MLVGSWSVMGMEEEVALSHGMNILMFFSQKISEAFDAICMMNVEMNVEIQDIVLDLNRIFFNSLSHHQVGALGNALHDKMHEVYNFCTVHRLDVNKFINLILLLGFYYQFMYLGGDRHEAAISKSAEVISCLRNLAQHYNFVLNVNMQLHNDYYPTLLFVAAKENDLEAVKALLQENDRLYVGVDSLVENSLGQKADDLENGPGEEVKSYIADSRVGVAAW